MRANYVQKCYLPEFVSMAACTSANSQYYLNKLKQNIEYMRLYHHGLYLGQNKLQSFKSKALMASSTCLYHYGDELLSTHSMIPFSVAHLIASRPYTVCAANLCAAYLAAEAIVVP